MIDDVRSRIASIQTRFSQKPTPAPRSAASEGADAGMVFQQMLAAQGVRAPTANGASTLGNMWGTQPSMYGSPPYGATPYGMAPYGATPYGGAPYGATPYGATPYGATPYGATPYGMAPYGATPYGMAPYGATPYGSAPYGAVPSGGAVGPVPERAAQFRPAFEAAGARYGVDPDLLAAVAWTESAFNPRAVSHAGALGLMQIMPGTAAGLGIDPTDPIQAIDGAARYLRNQIDRFGDVRLALAAYNAGPGAVERHGGIPPYPETTAYVGKVLGRLDQLRSQR